MDCDHCGAPVRDEDAFCSHCGGRIKRVHDVRPADPTATASERFDLVERSPGYTKACAHEPMTSSGVLLAGSMVFVAFGVVFMAVSVSSLGGQADHMGNFYYVWIGVCLLFIAAGAAMVGRAVKYARAPIVRRIAVVIDEHTRVSGGTNNSGASTTHYATLQVKDGSRTEFDCEAQVAGRIAAPDIGVAFTKDTHLVDFIRFEV